VGKLTSQMGAISHSKFWRAIWRLQAILLAKIGLFSTA